MRRTAFVALPLLGLLATADARSSSPPLPAATAPNQAPSLRNAQLWSPLPGGYIGGWDGDTGLDIAASFRPVYAVAAGTLEYSERGHTLWQTGRDTPNSVRLRLDAPIPWKDRHGRERHITHVYYTHMSALERTVAEGADSATKPHVSGGERLGVSGRGNGVPHLHLGLLLDGEVEQDSWDTLLVESEIRAVMGGYKNGELLPIPAPVSSPSRETP
jgi:murein DD-endopeptidase MepM/ murein hydrolase activator NlpD